MKNTILSAETIKPEEWWKKSQPNSVGKVTANIFEAPACENAEHRFLALLLLLTRDLNKNHWRKPPSVVPILLRSYDLHRETRAVAIQKLDQTRNGKVYRLHSATYLVLTGQLAGSIAEDVDARKRTKKVKYTPVTAYRALHDHGVVLECIETDIAMNQRAAQYWQKDKAHQIELLIATKELVEKLGYIPALLHCLEQLQPPHSAQSIKSNSILQNN